ncbi:MAG: GNAT family N-acetyltransferase [Elusimicrobia bacterium]|nr:GNAT family N-acetyltransferase [Elusimicrobiota bacterium]
MTPERLTTRRLVLRRVRASDWPSFYDHARREEVSRPAGFPAPRTSADTRRAVSAMAAQWDRPPLRRCAYSVFLKKDGTWVGGANLRWPHSGVAELGYSVHPDHWGKGYASEAAGRLVRLAWAQGAHRVQATCWVRNARSQRVLAKLGLRREGRLRGFLRRGDEVRDEYVYGLARADR